MQKIISPDLIATNSVSDLSLPLHTFGQFIIQKYKPTAKAYLVFDAILVKSNKNTAEWRIRKNFETNFLLQGEDYLLFTTYDEQISIDSTPLLVGDLSQLDHLKKEYLLKGKDFQNLENKQSYDSPVEISLHRLFPTLQPPKKNFPFLVPWNEKKELKGDSLFISKDYKKPSNTNTEVTGEENYAKLMLRVQDYLNQINMSSHQ
ncbi:MAG: hypothetical protein KBD63_01165 [Bacteriovoracaceae bacterium]|nr:hypothetical protein [Bacteriovoracaceae bacterium]